MTRQWLARLGGAVLIAVIGWVATTWLDFDPRPGGWFLLVLLACAIAWLLIDTTDTGRAEWAPGLPPAEDRFEETTADHRVLDNHLAADHPGPALRDRLVALARSRDPALEDPLLRELATSPPRKLRPAEIDQVLTRIEELREH